MWKKVDDKAQRGRERRRNKTFSAQDKQLLQYGFQAIRPYLNIEGLESELAVLKKKTGSALSGMPCNEIVKLAYSEGWSQWGLLRNRLLWAARSLQWSRGERKPTIRKPKGITYYHCRGLELH